MATNKYFNNFNYGREQDLIEDLTIEAIKIYGHDVKYMPRTLVKEDALYGEDTQSAFNSAIPLEMYVKNVEGFGGEGDFLNRFNIQVNDEITFTVARKRWTQIARGESLLTEVGYNYQLEEANTGQSSWSATNIGSGITTSSFLLEVGTPGSNNYTITSTRPNEGDLIYFPMTGGIFEIKFVEDESVFYQTGALQTYDLKCELFTYSSEGFNTGSNDIDIVETTFTADSLVYQFLLEDGDVLRSEDGGSILQEFRLETTQATANNEFFNFQGQGIIDFSEHNPFSEIDRY
jgi:hypothetical protein